MRLYISSGACSLSPHIALAESGLPYTIEKVSLATHKTDHDTDFYSVNDKGYVPLLELDDGRRLSEGPAIVQWIADQAPTSKLAPPNGTFERAQLQEWLNYIATELHKQFAALFDKSAAPELKAQQSKKIEKRLAWIEQHLGGRDYLMGADFSVADGYLFTIMRWTHYLKLETSKMTTLAAWYDRVAARPKVKLVLEAEGIRA
ncbi:MAG: glutathione transferase GstA [Polyangia bacterium]